MQASQFMPLTELCSLLAAALSLLVALWFDE